MSGKKAPVSPKQRRYFEIEDNARAAQRKLDSGEPVSEEEEAVLKKFTELERDLLAEQDAQQARALRAGEPLQQATDRRWLQLAPRPSKPGGLALSRW
jgi:hypothetical protein